MNEELEEAINLGTPLPAFETTTACDHEYGPGATNMDGFIEVTCQKCWHGCAYDPDAMHIEAGKLMTNV